MKRYLPRPVLIIVCGLVLMGSVALFSIPKKVYLQLVASSLGSAFQKDGVVIDFSGLSSSGLSLKATSADLLFTKAFLAFKLSDVQLRLKPLSFFRLAVGSSLTSGAYGGRLTAESANSLITGTGKFAASGTEINLPQIPLCEFIGVTGGTLSFEMPDLTIQEGLLYSLNTTFSIDKLEKAKETPPLPLISSIVRSLGIPYNGPIPPFRPISIKGSTRLLEQKLAIDEIVAKTAEGRATMKGDLDLSQQLDRILKASGSIEVKLSKQGLRSFGALLPLISKGKLTAQTKAFTISLNGPISKKNIVFSTP